MQTELPTPGVAVKNVPMGAPKLSPRYTVDEYLALERAAFERHIYLDGEIIAMAGENSFHRIISANLCGIVVPQLKGKPCQAGIKDTKVRSGLAPMAGHPMKGLFSYPDIVVICGEPEYHDAFGDIVLNPRCIIEVLSESTEEFDRGEKLTRFQTCNPSLTDYVLASQDKAQIEHFVKSADGEWRPHVYVGLEAGVPLTSIGCTLNLADVYDRVVFHDG